MDKPNLALLIQIAHEILSDKWYMTSMHFLWVYDYFLTLGDEITYVWSGMRSSIFVLFLANRYIPVLYLAWVNFTLFHRSHCHATKWVTIWITVVVTTLAQIAVTIRIYAITERNKLFAGALSVMIVTQMSFGIYLIVKDGKGPGSPLPQINLDAFIFCASGGLRLEGVVFTGLGIAFDVVAFVIIAVRARRPTIRFPGIPNLLDTILRGATIYFVLIFTCQLLFLFFLLFAPPRIMFTPGVAYTIFTPIMASRLMLSLKKAPAKSPGLQSFGVTSGSRDGETIHIPPGALSVNRRISGMTNGPASDIELEPVQNLSWTHG